MYGREYNGKSYTLEASGGLMNSSLVMQDRETDSYWSLMKGEVVAGALKGTRIAELPVSQKMKWKDWVKKYPNSKVLSVDGREDAGDVYADYFSSDRGFRGSQARDKRLKTKEPIFAFQHGDKKFAAPLSLLEGGRSFDLGEIRVFLYRPHKADIFYSTLAFFTTGSGFKKIDGVWADIDTGCRFDPAQGVFPAERPDCPQKFTGFDTFWYNWSLNNPETEVLGTDVNQQEQ